jgi:hypothetical protein
MQKGSVTDTWWEVRLSREVDCLDVPLGGARSSQARQELDDAPSQTHPAALGRK